MEIKNAQPYRTELIGLLNGAGLPFDDLPKTLDNFIVAIVDGRVAGAAGIETYGDSGLLRSVVVEPALQGKGIAGQLLNTIEEMAAGEGIKQLILLTETAQDYFEKKGFHRISRDEVPEAVKISTEFSHVCPVSAIVLFKPLTTHIMKNILVLCTGNSCRSQMAEGYLRHFAGDKAAIYSAGVKTHGVNLKAIQVMAEDHIDISKHTSNHVDEYQHIPFDMVITVCDNANEACPFFPGNVQRFHQNFPDPPKATGTPDEIMNEFRRVRDMIKVYAANFVQQHLE